jgi:hypothetical protein
LYHHPLGISRGNLALLLGSGELYPPCSSIRGQAMKPSVWFVDNFQLPIIVCDFWLLALHAVSVSQVGVSFGVSFLRLSKRRGAE